MVEHETASHKINEHSLSLDLFATISGIDNASIHFGQSGEDISLLRLFYQMKDGFYIDIGAYDPTRYSNTFILHHFYNWRGLNIDPSKEVIEKFSRYRKNDINVQAAVGKPRKGILYKFEGGARNTFSKKNIERQQSKNQTKIIAKEEVNIVPLENLLDKYLPEKKSINVLDIDVEGLEMEVLESNNWKKYRPQVILVEDYKVGQGMLKGSVIQKYLSRKSYDFIGHHFDTSIYLDSLNKTPELPKISRTEFIDNLEATAKKYGAELTSKETLDKLAKRLEESHQKFKTIQTEKENITNSTSWKITRPLRRISAALKSIKK